METNQNNTVSRKNTLEQKAKSDAAFNAVCHVFALRERTRKQVMLNSLKVKMKKEGFDFSHEQYLEVIKFLASLGYGKLKHNRANRIVGLTEVRTKLQRIGEMALGKVQVPQVSTDAAPKVPVLIRKKQEKMAVIPTTNAPATIIMTIGGKTVKIESSDGISAKDLLTFLGLADKKAP